MWNETGRKRLLAKADLSFAKAVRLLRRMKELHVKDSVQMAVGEAVAVKVPWNLRKCI